MNKKDGKGEKRGAKLYYKRQANFNTKGGEKIKEEWCQKLQQLSDSNTNMCWITKSLIRIWERGWGHERERESEKRERRGEEEGEAREISVHDNTYIDGMNIILCRRNSRSRSITIVYIFVGDQFIRGRLRRFWFDLIWMCITRKIFHSSVRTHAHRHTKERKIVNRCSSLLLPFLSIPQSRLESITRRTWCERRPE